MSRTARILVQAGHYPRKTGATGTAGEQVLTLNAAKATVAELHRRGYPNAGWAGADIPTRFYLADVFVALHGDGSVHSEAAGASAGWQTSTGKAIAQLWKRAYVARGWGDGWRPDNYTAALAGYYGVSNAVALNPRCRAWIIEAGFLTNPANRAELDGPADYQRIADSIADAIDRSYGLSTPSPTEDDDMKITDTLGEAQTPTREIYNDGVSVGGALDGLLERTEKTLELLAGILKGQAEQTAATADLARAIREGSTNP